MIAIRSLALVFLGTAFFTPPASAAIESASVERTDQGGLAIRWAATGPVDVYVASRPDAAPGDARLISKGDRDGVHMQPAEGGGRPYFLLRDSRDGGMLRVAERLLPLEHGSNFRDIGGYKGAGGKHVRWGRIYRSGAMPLLSEKDYGYLGGLGIAAIVDLRSMEERQIAPTVLDERTGALYIVNDYSGKAIFSQLASATADAGQHSAMSRVSGEYRKWLISLAPQYRAIFSQLLDGKGAVAYNCSAGQDRTGVGTALILAALGVPRATILADYHLSTALRRPQNEMPPIGPADHPGNVVAEYYRTAMSTPEARKPRPLYTKAGAPYLEATFEEIDRRWGSVESYLDEVLGVSPTELALLRATYLE